MDRRKKNLIDKLQQLQEESDFGVKLVGLLCNETTFKYVTQALEILDSKEFLSQYPLVSAHLTESLDHMVEFNCVTEALIEKVKLLFLHETTDETEIGQEHEPSSSQEQLLLPVVFNSAINSAQSHTEACTNIELQQPAAVKDTSRYELQSLNCADDVKLTLLDNHVSVGNNDVPTQEDPVPSLILNAPEEPSSLLSSPQPSKESDCVVTKQNNRIAIHNIEDETSCSSSSSHESSNSSFTESSCESAIKVPFDRFTENPGSFQEIWLGMIEYIDTPSEFYVHIGIHENLSIDEFHSELQAYFSETGGVDFLSKQLAQVEGNFFACYYPHDLGGWYRGQVLDWYLNEGEVTVQLVDYGHKYTASLEMLRQLPEEFTNQPLFATRCHLAFTKPPANMPEWPQASINMFREECSKHIAYQMVPVGIVEGTTQKSLNHCQSVSVVITPDTDEVESINDILTETGFAEFVEWPIKNGTCEKTLDVLDVSSGAVVCIVPNSAQSVNEDDLDAWQPIEEAHENRDYDDENACIAVSGYEAKDEERICRFYASSGICYKKNCQKEHTFMNRDGYTTDTEMIYIRAFNSLSMPAKGTYMKIEVTYVLESNYFYAIDSPSKSSLEPDSETLLTLVSALNNQNNVRKFKKLQISPANGQIVVAQYQTDGRWYRAQVVDNCNENNLARVLFVDYGNVETVPEKFVRVIEPKFLHLPFQARKFSLGNILLFENSLTAAAEFFHSIVSHKVLKARVLNSCPVESVIRCQLADEDGVDIGIIMKRNGFGNFIDPSDRIQLDYNQSHLPG